MTYVTKLTNGKYQIDSVAAYCEMLKGKVPESKQSLLGLIDAFDEQLIKVYPTINRNALNNVHGDWYEWFIALHAWNFHVDNPNSLIMLLLPNITQFDVVRLYIDYLYDLVVDLRMKVKESTSVQLITSNPDFVLIDSSRFKNKLPKQYASKISRIDAGIISMVETAYKDFANKCTYADIAGYVSAKISLRPDRRLQIPHEGSLMKAIYTHLQTRQWIIHPKGLKYYAITTKATDADKKALKTVATHSLTSVFDIPQAAVDEVFEVNTLAKCSQVFSSIL